MANKDKKKDRTNLRYMKVFGNRVVIRTDKNVEEHVRESGLILPDNVEPVDARGIVIAVGHEVDQTMIKPGDRVVYNDHAGSELIWGGNNFVIMRDVDVFITIATFGDPAFSEYHENDQSWMVEMSEMKG